MAETRRRSAKGTGGDDRQLRIAWVDLEQYPDAVCRHGTFVLDVCSSCVGEIEASVAEFEQGVRDGKWNAEGYTPAEHRAQARREKRTTW